MNTKPNVNIDEWSYESVEYSNGYYFTVFDSSGKAITDTPTEAAAQEVVKNHNQDAAILSRHGRAADIKNPQTLLDKGEEV